MNRVVHINLGGYAFTMDDDAYDHLSAYLQTLQRHFRGTEGADEIIADIEARLAELFRESLGSSRSIVVMHDVEEAIAVMGTPEDFGAESGDHTTQGEPFIRTGKRLFRDTENKVMAGVCSGIAAYFGITDPVWVRLFFAIIFLSGGFGFPLYFILWAIMPEAKTAADRLAMHGEPINVSNISRMVKEEIGNLSEKVSELNKEFTGKDQGEAIHKAFERGSTAFAAAASTGATLLATILAKISTFAVIIILLVFAAVWFGIIGGLIFGYPYLGFLFPGQEMTTTLGSLSLLFAIGLPLVGMALAMARMVFRTRVSTAWKVGLMSAWFLSVIGLFGTGSKLAYQFSAYSRVPQDLNVEALKGQEVRLSVVNPISHENGGQFFNGKMQIDEEAIRWQNADLRIYHSDNGQWRLVERRYGRGVSVAEAETLAKEVLGTPQITDNHIELPGSSVIRRGQKWRAQEVVYELYVPEGATIRFDPGTKDLVSSVDIAEDGQYDFWAENQVNWQMTPLGLASK